MRDACTGNRGFVLRLHGEDTLLLADQIHITDRTDSHSRVTDFSADRTAVHRIRVRSAVRTLALERHRSAVRAFALAGLQMDQTFHLLCGRTAAEKLAVVTDTGLCRRIH